MRLRDLMTHPVATCPATSTLDHAARLMWEFDCGIIPVVDDDGQVKGVVTDRDICMAAYTQGAALHAIPVTTAMARDVVSVHADDSVETAEQMMRDRQVRRLPVIDDHWRPIGMVSMNDLARAATKARRPAVERELVQTLASICQPRNHTLVKPDAETREIVVL